MKHTTIALCTSFLLLASSLHAAERRAIIVSTRTGDAAILEDNRRIILQARALLETSGFKPSDISIFGDGGKDATTAALTHALTELASNARSDDELWFFLFGYANVNTRGVSIALSGERLYGNQLADMLDKIPGRQFVFCLNQQSAALMPLLSRGGRVVITATSDPAQLNPPVFPGYLFNAWATSPTNALLDILRNAQELTTNYFASAGLAEAESPQAFDGITLLSSPFTNGSAGPLGSLRLAESIASSTLLASTPTNLINTATPPVASTQDKGTVSLEDIRKALEEADPPEAPVQSATPETRALVAAASNAAPAYVAFPAFDLADHRQLLVGPDKSVFETDESTTYLSQDRAAEEYGAMQLEDSPPNLELSLKLARIIYPDGTYRDVKPRRIRTISSPVRSHFLRFPGAASGCVIQCSIEYREAASEAMPDFQRDILLQREIPCLSRRVILTTPRTLTCHHKLYRSSAEPSLTTNDINDINTFDLGAVPALEPLAFDPPLSETAIRLMISSTPTWADFAAWTERILRDSDKVDDTTAALATRLASHATNDTGKVKAIYDFLCELRYETIPVGARGLRPRLPGEVCTTRWGDCKDKANALVAMARIVGVEGHITLVNRLSSTDPDVPGWQFNHAIAYFPHVSGFTNGLWCDATDGSTPFGTLPPGDIGRQALVLDPTALHFAPITMANTRGNTYSQTLLFVATNGQVHGQAAFDATGLPDYFLRQAFKHATPLQARQYFQARLAIPGLSADHPVFTPTGDLSTPFHVEAVVNGTEWSVTPRNLSPALDLWAAVAAPDRDRPLQLNDGQPVQVSQRITMTGVPPVSESTWTRESDYFTATVEYTSLSNGWTRNINLQLTQPTVPAAAYTTFRHDVQDFYTAIHSEPDLKK